MTFYPDLASSSSKLPEAVARDMKDYDEVCSMDGVRSPDMEAAVARRLTDQTQLNLLTDFVENNYLKKAPDQVRTNRDIFNTTWDRGKKASGWVLYLSFSFPVAGN